MIRQRDREEKREHEKGMKDSEINTLKAEKDKITKESELKERVH